MPRSPGPAADRSQNPQCDQDTVASTNDDSEEEIQGTSETGNELPTSLLLHPLSIHLKTMKSLIHVGPTLILNVLYSIPRNVFHPECNFL